VGRPRITLDLFGHRLGICPQDASIREEKKVIKPNQDQSVINPKNEAVYETNFIFIAQY
jgi:hypothetical protein